MTSDLRSESPPTRWRGPTPVPGVDLDLDTQIERVEQRLVAREAWLRVTSESLGHRARVAFTPRDWMLPAAGLGVVAWLGWRLWHRRAPPQLDVVEVVPTVVAVRHPVEVRSELPWAGLLALGWPLLPSAWRRHLSPAAAATVVSAALSIGRRLFGGRVRRGCR